MIATTAFIDHSQIERYLGVVTSSAVGAVSVFRDMFAALRDLTGGRIASYEHEMDQLARVALNRLLENASRMGADAVIGIQFSVGIFSPSEKGTVASVLCSGTAVKLKRVRENDQNREPSRPERPLPGTGFDWR